MLRIVIDGQQNELEVKGNPVSMAAELTGCIASVYQSLRGAGDPIGAEVFKLAVRAVLENDSPAWDKEIPKTAIVVPIKRSDSDGG